MSVYVSLQHSVIHLATNSGITITNTFNYDYHQPVDKSRHEYIRMQDPLHIIVIHNEF